MTWKGSIVSFPRVNFYGDLGDLKMKEEKERHAKTKQLKQPPFLGGLSERVKGTNERAPLPPPPPPTLVGVE